MAAPDPTVTKPPRTRDRLRATALRAAAMAAAWWALVEGRTDTWLFALPVIVVAAIVSMALQPRPRRIRVLPAIVFVARFLHRSAGGGIDVARRALHPRMPIAPGFLDLPLHLADPGARLLVANTMSLLPGTLSAELHGDTLRLHVIDMSMPASRQLADTEAQIARMLDLPLEPSGDRLP